MLGRTLGLAMTLAGLAVATGCGGGSVPSVAQLATTTTSSAAGARSTAPDRAALATCFTSHGFAASFGSGGGGNLTFDGVAFSGNVDPSSPQFQAAVQACRKYMPSGPPPPSAAQRAEGAKAMVRFAGCMRENGVPNFPDPDSDGTFSFSSLKQLGIGIPDFQSAFKTCEPLEPKVGPRIVFGAGNIEQRRS